MTVKARKLKVKDIDITVLSEISEEEFIPLTDIARYKNPSEPKDVVKNWMRTRNSIEFLGLWEKLNNPEFKGVEFDSFRFEAGSNSFVLTPSRWIEKTGAKGIITRSGNRGGTFAHKDIAFEFASWVSVEFKLYLIKEFQRLKATEKRARLGHKTKSGKDKLPHTHRRDKRKPDTAGTFRDTGQQDLCL